MQVAGVAVVGAGAGAQFGFVEELVGCGRVLERVLGTEQRVVDEGRIADDEALASGGGLAAATVAVMGWIYRRAAVAEEAKFAASPLAEAYQRYAAATGRFLPRLWPRRPRA